MKAFDAYKKYVAIKLHFHGNYDYFKFAGKSKVSKDRFETRKDRFVFERLAKIYDAEQYELLLVANLLDNSEVWIGEIASDIGRERYLKLKKRLQSLQYEFKQDMNTIHDLIESGAITSFDALFTDVANDSPYPHIVALMVQRDISLETFIIMNKILNFVPRLHKHTNDDILWPEINKLVSKYSGFVRVDLKPFRDIMKAAFLKSSKKSLDVRE